MATSEPPSQQTLVEPAGESADVPATDPDANPSTTTETAAPASTAIPPIAIDQLNLPPQGIQDMAKYYAMMRHAHDEQGAKLKETDAKLAALAQREAEKDARMEKMQKENEELKINAMKRHHEEHEESMDRYAKKIRPYVGPGHDPEKIGNSMKHTVFGNINALDTPTSITLRASAKLVDALEAKAAQNMADMEKHRLALEQQSNQNMIQQRTIASLQGEIDFYKTRNSTSDPLADSANRFTFPDPPPGLQSYYNQVASTIDSGSAMSMSVPPTTTIKASASALIPSTGGTASVPLVQAKDPRTLMSTEIQQNVFGLQW